MATHKSAAKRHRQSLRRRDRNRENRIVVRNALRQARAAVAAGDKGAPDLVKAAERVLAKASTKGIIHKRNAARRIGRLTSSLRKGPSTAVSAAVKSGPTKAPRASAAKKTSSAK